MAAVLPEFEQLQLDAEPSSLGVEWKQWSDRLENLFVALAITDEKRQKAFLLHYGGRVLSTLCGTLLASTDEMFKLAKVKLDAYFEPQINHTFETYVFRCMRQDDYETVGQFATRLKVSASRCNFHDDKREIRDQIVMNCSSQQVRKKSLRDTSIWIVYRKLQEQVSIPIVRHH